MGPRFCISNQLSWDAYDASPLMSLRSKKSGPRFANEVQRSEMTMIFIIASELFIH